MIGRHAILARVSKNNHMAPFSVILSSFLFNITVQFALGNPNNGYVIVVCSFLGLQNIFPETVQMYEDVYQLKSD
jgi:hypothetical protein